MNNDKESIFLPPEAILIYKIISEKRELEINELENISKLSRGKIEYNLPFLQKHDLLDRKERINKFCSLTKEGEEAEKNQLIERRIYNLIKEKK